MINIVESSVNWNEGYANSPNIEVTLDAGEIEAITSGLVYKSIHENEDQTNYLIAVDKSNGLAAYGVYSNKNLGSSAPQTWRGASPYVLKIEKDNTAEEVKYSGYSSSRASVFSSVVGTTNNFDPKIENNIYDVSIYGKDSNGTCYYQYAVTHAFVENKLAPYLKERLTYVLACKRESNDKLDIENYALVLVPSLSPTEIVFPPSCKEKQQSISELYTVKFCF